MGAISEHRILTERGYRPLLEWLEGHRHRHYASFGEKEQLEITKEICCIEDNEARDLMLTLLQNATCLQNSLVKLHAEMDTLHKALQKCEADEDEQ